MAARAMMSMVTHLGGATSTVGLALAFIMVGRAERQVGITLLLANLASHAPVQVLKRWLKRPRPVDVHGRPLAIIDLPDPFSFPSGHSAAAASVAVVLSVSYPATAVIICALALLVAASRVTLGLHHISDVVAGLALGAAGAAVALQLVPF